MTNDQIGLAVGKLLLQAKAISVNRSQPFVLAGGWASPVYVDVRLLFGDPTLRRKVVDLALLYTDANLPSDAFEGASDLSGRGPLVLDEMHRWRAARSRAFACC